MAQSVISAEKMSDYVKKLEERIKKLEQQILTSGKIEEEEDKFTAFDSHIRKEYKTYYALKDAVVSIIDYLFCCGIYKVEVVCVHVAYYSIVCYRKCECDREPKILCEIVVQKKENGEVNIFTDCITESCSGVNFFYENTETQITDKFNRFFYELSFHDCEYFTQ